LSMREKETRNEQRMTESLRREILQNMYYTFRPLDKGEGISGLSYIMLTVFTVATQFVPKGARRIVPYWELLNKQFDDVPEINVMIDITMC